MEQRRLEDGLERQSQQLRESQLRTEQTLDWFANLFRSLPVAAILVASMRLRAVDVALNAQYRGPHELPCEASYDKGEEMGWFEHGSTILVLAPPGLALDPALRDGHRIRMGEALLQTTPLTPQTHDHG